MRLDDQTVKRRRARSQRKRARIALPPKFETVAMTEERRDQLIRQLKSAGSSDAMDLAALLEECGDEDFCGSAACPRCQRRSRVWWLRQGLTALEPFNLAFSVNLIPKGCKVAVGELGGFDFGKFIERELRAIQHAIDRRLWLILGGIDFSLNTHANANPYWQVHLYFVVGAPSAVTAENVRRVFERRGDCSASRRPLRVTLIQDGLPSALTYVLKSVFFRRSGYEYHSPGAGPTTNSKSQRLKATQNVELALTLHELGLGGRLLLSGVRRTGPKGRLRLTPTMRSK